MKFYWFNKKCCVAECYNSSTEGEGCYKEFFDLPAEPQARDRWLKAILCEDAEGLKICEDHFKDNDIFHDKNHRKKLRLNSVPSTKLPQYICSTCLGSRRPLRSGDFQSKTCQCITSPALPPVVDSVPYSPEKRVRLSWTTEEKRILFKAVEKHGEVKIVNSHIRINWNTVLNYCRNNGCFGNEKELKTAWQNLRARAAKVYKNEIYGTKLERRVSRFLYGKAPKIPSFNGSSSTSLRPSTDLNTSEEEFNEKEMETNEAEEEYLDNEMTDSLLDGSQNLEERYSDNVNNNNIDNAGTDCNGGIEKPNSSAEAKLADDKGESSGDSEDEYYSIEDVKNKLGIRIAPKISEVISLLSSDESGQE